MGDFDKIISRSDAEALIPEDAATEIIQRVPEESAALRLFRKLPNMSRKQRRVPVVSVMPVAYFVDGDTGLKKTTEQKWENKYLNAEEIACIVPIPEAVLDDADYDIWAEVEPQILAALGKVIDGAIFFGTNKPAAWPIDIVTAATSAGNAVAFGTGVDMYDDLLGENGMYAAVEADGFGITLNIASISMKAKLRGLRDANGQPIFLRSMGEKARYELDGEEIMFQRSGAFDTTKALMISGEANEAVYSIRQDVTYKVLTEAVIQDDAGDIVYNLAQQDMIALRVVMRLAWQVPNPPTDLQPIEANRYPFGVLTP